MQVIPVIDLKNGIAVHAVKGQREHYRPLQSRLCASPEPMAVLQGLLRLHPFRSVYLADLDALVGSGENRAIIHQLLGAFPDLEFWIDQGRNDADTARPANHVPVLGSESMAADDLARLPCRQDNPVLSLDFFGDAFAGPPTLLANPELWPPRVILMTLGRVGSQAGPDWQRLEAFTSGYPQTHWIAAGGVRHADDLQQLARLGVHAALIATALHDHSLSAADLRALGR